MQFQTKYPKDIFLCMLCEVILPPLVIFNINEFLRILIGLPFVLFFPGYMIISFLFPKNKLNGGLDIIERISYSFGISIAIIPLLGIILFYSPLGLRIESILLVLFCFIFGTGCCAAYRWLKTPPEIRFMINLKTKLLKFETETKFDRILYLTLLITIVITIATAIFVAFSPRKQETSTEFYLLGPTGQTSDYPHNLTIGQYSNVILGLINHEHSIINYTIEIWLINQTLEYNQSTDTNETIYHEMWFLDKITKQLNHFTENTESLWKPQWEYMYNFNITKIGTYKLTFLLYKVPTQSYNKSENYSDMAKQKIQSSYETNYLWLNISK